MGVLIFPVAAQLRRDIRRIAEEEQRTLRQICKMLLYGGVDSYKRGRGKVHAALGGQTRTTDEVTFLPRAAYGLLTPPHESPREQMAYLIGSP